MGAIHDRLRKSKLLIELQRSGLNRQRARGGARLRCLVDNPDTHAKFGEPQGQYQAGRSGAGNQYFGLTGSARHDTHINCNPGVKMVGVSSPSKNEALREPSLLWLLPPGFLPARWYAANVEVFLKLPRFPQSRPRRPAHWIWMDCENRSPCAQTAARLRGFRRRSPAAQS